jgi:hypothetical protein
MMDLGRNRRVLEACAWTGLPFLGLFLVGFWFVAGFVPPPSPEDGPVEVARAVAENATWIRAGMLIATAGAVLTLPWQAAIAIQMRRAEGPPGVLTVVWVMAAALFCLEFVYPLMFWMVTAYRPEGDPSVLQRFHDLSWISLLGVVDTAIVQAFALGIVVLRDRRSVPVYPRWFGYFCFWAGVLFAPASLIIFFRHGAFAWNGVVSWWLVLSVFAAWIVVLTGLTVRAVRADPGPTSPADATDELRRELGTLRAEVATLRGELRSPVE